MSGEGSSAKKGILVKPRKPYCFVVASLATLAAGRFSPGNMDNLHAQCLHGK